MIKTITFTVQGTPVPKGRARACIRNGKIAHYTPKKTDEYENQVCLAAALEMASLGIRRPLTGALAVSIEAYFCPPKSWSKAKKEAAIRGEIMPTSKPDLDNIVKAILDGMNDIVFLDDAQVIRSSESKSYANEAKVIICVSEA